MNKQVLRILEMLILFFGKYLSEQMSFVVNNRKLHTFGKEKVFYYHAWKDHVNALKFNSKLVIM